MTRARMSSRGSRPKIASERETFPASFPSRVLTLNSIGLAPLLRGRLDGVAHDDPGTLGTGYCTLDQDQTTIFVGRNHFKVLSRYARLAHVTSHLLVLENLARILARARRTVRAVRNRHTVRGAETAEAVALHGAGKALTNGRARHVDELTCCEVTSLELGTDLK